VTKRQENKLKAIIKTIRDTRTTNNNFWMELMELAVIYAPEKTLEVMKGIHECDGAIQKHLTSLVKELEKTIEPS